MSKPSKAAIGAWTSLVRAQAVVLGAVEADLKQAGFPPLAWYDVLLELEKTSPEGLRPVILEERLLLAQHNVSRLLSRLEAKGLLTRRPCPEDRRGQEVVITETGRELRQAMWPAYAAAIERHVGQKVDDDEAAALAGSLSRLTSRDRS